jgi:hypothetical protein
MSFEDNDNIQGQKESSVFLRNVVKPEGIGDQSPQVGVPPHPQALPLSDLPTFSSTLGFLTVLAAEYGTPPQRPQQSVLSPRTPHAAPLEWYFFFWMSCRTDCKFLRPRTDIRFLRTLDSDCIMA